MVEWKGNCENVAHWNGQGRVVECEGMGVSHPFNLHAESITICHLPSYLRL